MSGSIFQNTSVTLQTLKSADNETLTGATLDMKGYDGVAFVAVALKGEILAFSVKGQQGAESDLSDAEDLKGSATGFPTTVGADGLAVLELVQPEKRYVRAVVTVPDAAAATPTAVLAIRFRGKTLPISNTGKILLSPIEGAA